MLRTSLIGPRTRVWPAVLVWSTCWCCLGAPRSRAEGPGSAEPEAIWPVGPWEYSHEAYAQAVAKYKEAAQSANSVLYGQSSDGSQKQDEAGKDDNPPKKGTTPIKGAARKKGASKTAAPSKKGARLIEIGKAHTSVVQAQRLARVLYIYREPAAVDLQHRLAQLNARLYELQKVTLDDPKIAESVKKTEAKWLQDAEALRQKNGQKLDMMVAKSRWREATELLYELADELRPRAFWYDGAIAEKGLKPFVMGLPPLESKYLNIFQQESDTAIGKLLADALAAVDASAAEVETALMSAAGGSGPESITAVAARVRQVCNEALRARTLAWRASERLDKPRGEVAKLEKTCESMSLAFAAAVSQLIEADAARAPAADIPALYTRYLQALAPWVAEDGSGRLAGGTRAALNRLASKSEPFAAEVAAYASVTGDILRWRARFATARAKGQEGKYRAAEALFTTVDGKPVTDETWRLTAPEESGGVKRSPRKAPIQSATAPDAVKRNAPRLVGKDVSVNDVMGTFGQANEVYSRCQNRYYVRVAPPADLATLAAELKSSLWVSDAMPPLTLEAAVAIDSAQRGGCERLGGTFESFELEPLATRFATVGENDRGLLRLGPLPESVPRVFLGDYLFAMSLKPAWFQHRYGFVELK